MKGVFAALFIILGASLSNPGASAQSIVYCRSDILVAVRVIRKDSNGSVTLAWKLLKKYPVAKALEELTK